MDLSSLFREVEECPQDECRYTTAVVKAMENSPPAIKAIPV